MRRRVQPAARTLRVEFDIERKYLLRIRFREPPPLPPRLRKDDFRDAFPHADAAHGARGAAHLGEPGVRVDQPAQVGTEPLRLA